MSETRTASVFYLHEVEIRKRLEGLSRPLKSGEPQASRLILATKLEDVKNSSKVVDENGEPEVEAKRPTPHIAIDKETLKLIPWLLNNFDNIDNHKEARQAVRSY